ncbi:hypothetical protein ACIQAL_09450 [Pseudomonas sp. NPDC088368]|jgi:hypothetical protein|uniref:hypothetical protein n=1 Tax=Pseudomonas sp. NPDC088368 TaxID=3364453 RepID=UPI003828FC4B
MTLTLNSTRFGLARHAYKDAEHSTTDAIGIGVRLDEWVAYCGQIRPYFDQLNGIIGQLGGLLILGQARSCFEAYYNLASTPLEQIEECRCSLLTVRPPAMATEHYRHLSKAAAHVDDIARSLRRTVNSPDQLRDEIPRMVKALEAACSMLRCAADPETRLQTVDFADGCACCIPLQALSNAEQPLPFTP